MTAPSKTLAQFNESGCNSWIIANNESACSPLYGTCYHLSMPRKKTILTDEERAKRIRETARELGTDNDPKALDRAFKKVIRPKVPHPAGEKAASRLPRGRE
jgi:hypothetical protein